MRRMSVLRPVIRGYGTAQTTKSGDYVRYKAGEKIKGKPIKESLVGTIKKSKLRESDKTEMDIAFLASGQEDYAEWLKETYPDKIVTKNNIAALVGSDVEAEGGISVKSLKSEKSYQSRVSSATAFTIQDLSDVLSDNITEYKERYSKEPTNAQFRWYAMRAMQDIYGDRYIQKMIKRFEKYDSESHNGVQASLEEILGGKMAHQVETFMLDYIFLEFEKESPSEYLAMEKPGAKIGNQRARDIAILNKDETIYARHALFGVNYASKGSGADRALSITMLPSEQIDFDVLQYYTDWFNSNLS